MSKPIWSPGEKRRLDRVTTTLRLGRDGTIRVEAQGWSDAKRSSLWSTSETWVADDPVYGPSDSIHHLALVVLQDRPNTPERLFFGMNGGLPAIQEEMFPST